MRTQARGDTSRRQILAFVRLRWLETQEATTVREIANAVGRSPASVHRHVQVLTEQGLIEHKPGSGRTIRPVQPARGSTV